MTDILIIGGGIAGLSAAARLSALGSVLLLEAESQLATQTSARSAAVYEAEYGKPSTVALNRASGAYLRNGGYLSPRGLMLLAGQGEEEAFAADCTQMRADRIDMTEACAMVPILDPSRVRMAAYHDAAFDIDTDKLVQDFARGARAAGGEILCDAQVTAIRRTDGGWAVDAGGQTHEARVLVNGAGAWADEVARMAGAAPLGLTPLRRSMARIAAPGGHEVSQWPLFFGPGESWYAKPDAGALLVSPADEDPCPPMDAWPDDMVLAEGLARYQSYVTEPVTRPIATWAGLRTFAPDRELVIGPDPTVPDFFWCAAQGGYGMQTSPAASQLLADRVAGAVPAIGAEVAARLDPARFS